MILTAGCHSRPYYTYVTSRIDSPFCPKCKHGLSAHPGYYRCDTCLREFRHITPYKIDNYIWCIIIKDSDVQRVYIPRAFTAPISIRCYKCNHMIQIQYKWENEPRESGGCPNCSARWEQISRDTFHEFRGY